MQNQYVYLGLVCAAVFVLIYLPISHKRKKNHRERTIQKQKKRLKNFLDHVYSSQKATDHEIEKFAHEAARFSHEAFEDVPISYSEIGARMKDIILKRGTLSERSSSFEMPQHEKALIQRAEVSLKTMLQNI